MSACTQAAERSRHQRHRPERTVLHAIVREHLDAFVRHADEHYARPLPRYVREAFKSYLRCGIPEHGFLRLRCDECGHDRVVAFSCKQRGACPSCAGRTMTNTAAHLVDRVLPNVPLRQWVLSLPFPLRTLAARRADVIAAIDRILFAEIQRTLRRGSGPKDGRAGAVTFVQRFGGSLNLHVHFHVLVLEGLFTRDGDALPVFHPALPPTRSELLEVLTRVRTAVTRWLSRKGLADGDSARDDRDVDALDACANVAVQQGLFDKLDGAPIAASDHDEAAHTGRNSVALEGFNLHAAVSVGADDDQSRERLVRYCARPAFALERLSMLADGRIAYRIKPARNGATHRILEPLELLARIAALILPPRHPFLRYHGVLGPSSKWRSAIVPRADASTTGRATHAPRPPNASMAAAANVPINTSPVGAISTTSPSPTLQGLASVPRPPPQPHGELPPTPSANSAASPGPAPRAAFARITSAHIARLGGGDLLARTTRIEWSKLLRRTFAADVLTCPRCTGRARIIAAVQDPAVARSFLDALSERSTPIRSNARARDDGEPVINLDTLAAGHQPRPAPTAHSQRDAAETTETTDGPHDHDPDEVEYLDHDPDEVEYLEPPSSIPDLEAPDD